MTQFENLTELFIAFGPHAQDALDFISNEDNLRKFKTAQQKASSSEVEPTQSCTPSPISERDTETVICIALDNHRFIDKEDWENGNYTKDDVVGIAVHTPAVSFIVGLTEWEAKWSEDTDALITKRHTEAQALQVISGLEDTRKIVEAQKDEEETAAKLCWNYNHKSLQWYLPSLLELNAMCAYQNEINELMELVGGEPLSTGYHWSSTENSTYISWYVDFGDGYSNSIQQVQRLYRSPCCSNISFVLQS